MTASAGGRSPERATFGSAAGVSGIAAGLRTIVNKLRAVSGPLVRPDCPCIMHRCVWRNTRPGSVPHVGAVHGIGNLASESMSKKLAFVTAARQLSRC